MEQITSQPLPQSTTEAPGFLSRLRAKSVLSIGLVATELLAVGGLLSACDLDGNNYTESGVVVTGANGKNYVLPKGAERPVYDSRTACVTDVTQQLKKEEKKTGTTFKQTPAELCQPVSEYANAAIIYPYGYYFGPIIDRTASWKSSRVVSWQHDITSGTFAAKGNVQENLETAPKSAQPGESETITEKGNSFGQNRSSYSDDNSDGEGSYHGGGSSGDDDDEHVSFSDGGDE